jgi:arylsulfatase
MVQRSDIRHRMIDFEKSIINFPSIKRFPGGASNDLRPNLQNPNNPVPNFDTKKPPHVKGSGG